MSGTSSTAPVRPEPAGANDALADGRHAADPVEVTLLDIEMGGLGAARSVPADMATLARVVGHDAQAVSIEADPYWLTVSGGRVTKVEQQYS